ncbi:MAG: AAA family ATPase [Crocosphaera sp.]
MKLLKVSVPNFRNLKNVELTFEPSLKPAVFPIGSENGGGKSTLFQLIFVLLTCSLDEGKNIYLSNLLSSITDDCIIAEIEIIYQDKMIHFEFHVIANNQVYNEELFEFISKKIELTEKLDELFVLEGEQKEQQGVFRKVSPIVKPRPSILPRISNYSFHEQIEDIKERLNLFDIEIKRICEQLNVISISILKQSNNNIYNPPKLLICKTNIDDYNLALESLKFASKHIYIAVPPNQSYLFLDKYTKKLLLSELGKYQSYLSQIKEAIPNLYVYTQVAVTEILHAFKQALNNDFRTAINNDNLEYGTALKELVEDFHNFLGNDKYIFPSDDMTSIIVRRKISDNKFIELEPEELSHGELKRLGLYAWIKYNNINDSIILIDEIENGLHPDWQYNIVNELASWGDNQYLLATHSFYLCEALTPGHVKEIEPKMLNPNSEE